MLVRFLCSLSLLISAVQGVCLWSQTPLEVSHIHVTSLRLEGASPLEALLVLGNSASLPLGIAVSDPTLYTSHVSKDFDGGTCDEVLRLILESVPKYSVQESHGAVLIGVKEDLQVNGLLHYKLDHFDTYRQMDATDVSAALWGVLQLSLNPKRTGYGGVLMVPALDQKILPVISMSQPSLEEVLDKLVVTQARMAWISWPPPSTLIDVPQYLLWNLVFYDADPTASKLCCVHIPPNLQEVSGDLRKRLE